jgi:hypothetical protein
MPPPKYSTVSISCDASSFEVLAPTGCHLSLMHEPQQQHRLGEVAQRSSTSAGADPGAVSGEQSGDGLGEVARDVEAGTLEEHVGS